MKKSNGRVTTLNVMTGEEFNAFRIFDDYFRDSVKRTNELELAHCFLINFTHVKFSYIFYQAFLKFHQLSLREVR